MIKRITVENRPFGDTRRADPVGGRSPSDKTLPTASSSPSPPSRTGSRPGGKKAADRIGTDYLDWALDGFSGYIAADELYDGPFCVLSIVDNRAFRRLCYEVLDHAPTHRDIRRFFRRFRAALTGRGLTLRGVTTDGSDLYPRPISEVFGAVEHQVCRFHILAELNKAVLRAIARVRKHLAAQQPELPRGRPGTPEARRKARRRRHLQRKVGDLFEHRHLFVKRHLAEGRARYSDASLGVCLSWGPSDEWWRRSTGCSTAGAALRRP